MRYFRFIAQAYKRCPGTRKPSVSRRQTPVTLVGGTAQCLIHAINTFEANKEIKRSGL